MQGEISQGIQSNADIDSRQSWHPTAKVTVFEILKKLSNLGLFNLSPPASAKSFVTFAVISCEFEGEKTAAKASLIGSGWWKPVFAKYWVNNAGRLGWGGGI